MKNLKNSLALMMLMTVAFNHTSNTQPQQEVVANLTHSVAQQKNMTPF